MKLLWTLGLWFRRIVLSLFVLPCPQECNFQSKTEIEPDLRLNKMKWRKRHTPAGGVLTKIKTAKKITQLTLTYNFSRHVYRKKGEIGS